jgi:hypothetical protein
LSHKDDEHKRADLYNSANNAPFHLWGHMAVERLTLHETGVKDMEGRDFIYFEDLEPWVQEIIVDLFVSILDNRPSQQEKKEAA